jgi:hypothetical protein
MKAYEGVDVETHVFFAPALLAGEWSASRPGRFILGKRAPRTHLIGAWMCPRAGLDVLEQRKFLTLPRLVFDLSVVQPVASRYTD